VSERTEVINKTVGFSFYVKVEREIRTETGAKYPDKALVTANLGGNADSFEEATKRLKEARAAIDIVLTEKKPEQNQTPTEEKKPTEKAGSGDQERVA